MQRMLFARLLLQDARVIVLDEPFNAVDAKTSADLFDLVRRWHGEQRTVLTAMHDIDFVRANFPETLLLARKPVAWGRTSTVLTPENLLAARRMCEAFDEHADLCAADEPALAASSRSPVLSGCRQRGSAVAGMRTLNREADLGQPEIAYPGMTEREAHARCRCSTISSSLRSPSSNSCAGRLPARWRWRSARAPSACS